MLTDEELKAAMREALPALLNDEAKQKLVNAIRKAEREKGEASSLWSEPGRLTAEAGEFLDAHMMELWPWASTLCSAHQIPDPECPTCNRSRRPTPYADKVLEVAVHAPKYVESRNQGQLAEQLGITMGELQKPGILESILRAQDIAHRIQWAEQMIQAANDAAMKREGAK